MLDRRFEEAVSGFAEAIRQNIDELVLNEFEEEQPATQDNRFAEPVKDELGLDKMFEDVLSDMDNNVIKPMLIERPINRGHFSQIDRLFNMFRGAYRSPVDAFICGGYVRWACSPLGDPVPPQDLDIYCSTEDVFNKLRGFFTRIGLRAKLVNEVSVTYHRGNNDIWATLPPIQLIKPLQEGRMMTTGSMTDILANFDFSIIRCGFDAELFSRRVAMCDVDFEKDETAKRLVLKNIHCPVSSMFRCIKYCNRGYKLATHEMLKLFVDWETRPPEYRETIKKFFARMSLGVKISATEFNTMYRSMRVD